MIQKRKLAAALSLAVLVGAVVALSGGAVADPAPPQAQSDVAPDEDGPRQDGDDEDEPSGDNETVTTVDGTLKSSPGEDYRLKGLVIDIGAEWYVNNETAPEDFDEDGSTERIREEFDGLVGQDVTMTVESDGQEGDVLKINGQVYREQGPPPWAGPPPHAGAPPHAGPPGR
jgi:hypothetical protein